MMLTITQLYAGLLALWFLVLSFHVVRFRTGGINLGDGGRPEVLRAIRAHANFAEYVPFVLLMMAMLETGGVLAPWVLHAIGLMLLVGRLLHGIALAFTKKWFLGRSAGILLTFASLAIAAVLCVWRGLAPFTL